MGLTQSNADPCLYFKWVKGRIVMIKAWIDDNAIIGQESDVLDLKNELKKQFECNDCRPMVEYVGCKIKKCKSGGIKFLQKVLL